jgi:outer membrane protein assembly factor BamD (BamD/ComL family)
MKRRYLPLFFLISLIAACSSGPVNIPEEISPEELIQRGQEASDRNRYNQAIQYYEAVIERFPSNADAICAAEYEIAFIHYKQKKYDDARDEFHTLLARYSADTEGYLPPEFKILSEKVLEKIELKTTKKSETPEPTGEE